MKHCRLIVKALKKEIPGIQITRLRHRTHVIFELAYRDVTRHMAVSASPKNTDHTILSAVREAKRLLGLK